MLSTSQENMPLLDNSDDAELLSGMTSEEQIREQLTKGVGFQRFL